MRRRLVFAILLVASLGLALTTSAGKAATVNDLAWFVIDDEVSEAALSSDGQGEYRDWRLPGDPCVTAWAASTGLFFAYLYRGTDLGDDCNGTYPETVRTFTLKFPEGSGACTALALDPLAGICTLEVDTTDGFPRIRAEKLFGRTAVATPVAFLFSRGASYEVRLDSDAAIIASGAERTLSNEYGTASLWKLGGKKPLRVGSPFAFPFTLRVTRVTP